VKVRITQEFFMTVTEEWYDPAILSGEGTIAEQICDYEKGRFERNSIYFEDLKKGTTKVEVVRKEEEKDLESSSDTVL